MNAHERKVVRDAHLRRLGGPGAEVRVAGTRLLGTLYGITGANVCEVQFVNRTTHGTGNTWPVKAERLQPV